MFELSQVHFCDFHQSEIFLVTTGKFFQTYHSQFFQGNWHLVKYNFFSFLQVTFSLGKLKCCCMFFL